MKKTGKVIMGVLLALALTVSGFAGVAQAEEVQAADDVCTVAFAPNAADAVGFTPAQAIPKNTPTALNINGFSRTGYTFLGWNTSPGGDGIGFANGQVVTLETGMTLFAQWSAPAASEKDSKEEKKEKEPAGEGTADKQDKTPAAGEGAPAEGDQAPAEEPKVEAPAEGGEPVVTEPAEEEKKEEAPAAEEVTEEDDDVEEAAPSGAPAQLDGEKDEEAVTEEAVEEEAEEKEEDEPEEVAEAEPEAALEKAPEKVKISFDANGGKGSMEAVEVEKGKDYTLPKSTFTKPSGKEFDSWDKGAVGDKIKADKDMTIKAMWNVQVSFDANGRGKAPSAQTVVVGSKAKEPKAFPPRAIRSPAGIRTRSARRNLISRRRSRTP